LLATGVISSNFLLPKIDGWLEFTTKVGSDFIIGFATYNTINWNQFANAIYVNPSSNLIYAYKGTLTIAMSPWQA